MILKLSSYEIQTAIEKHLKGEYNLDVSDKYTETIFVKKETKGKDGKKLKKPRKSEITWFGFGEPAEDETIEVEIFICK